jgi:hypothetical protein
VRRPTDNPLRPIRTVRSLATRVVLSSMLSLLLIVALGSRLGADAPPVEVKAAAVQQPPEPPSAETAPFSSQPSEPLPNTSPPSAKPAKWFPEPGRTETIIGYSQGGRPLTVYHLGDLSETADSVFIMGGQHGGPEANTMRLAWQLLEYFQRRPEEIPASFRLDFLPEANPDGLAIGSRQFLSGVDPNRNWDGRNWNTDAADSNGVFRRGLGGPEPFSEPETQILRDFVLASRPALTINYHSRGGFLFGGGPISEVYSAASGYFRPSGGGGTPGAGSAGSVLGYSATGSMNVWMGQEGYPAMLIELASAIDSEFSRNLPAVNAALGVLAEGQ